MGETDALGYARQMHRWWLERGVYPVFFAWESDLLEILRQYVVGPRDIFDFTTDPAIEVAAKPFGTLAWSGMKDSALTRLTVPASGPNPYASSTRAPDM